MDIASILGIVAGFGLVIGTIMLGGSLMAFVNMPGIVIVLGGTLAATLISEKLSVFIGAAKVALKAFFSKPVLVDQTINRLVELATLMRKDGALALENEQIDDLFLAKGVRLAVDGLAPDEVHGALMSEMRSLKERHRVGHRIFRFMGSTAPAMGMVGTLRARANAPDRPTPTRSVPPWRSLLTTCTARSWPCLVFDRWPSSSAAQRTRRETSVPPWRSLCDDDAVRRGPGPFSSSTRWPSPWQARVPHKGRGATEPPSGVPQAAGRADATQGAHEEAQVEPADVDAHRFRIFASTCGVCSRESPTLARFMRRSRHPNSMTAVSFLETQASALTLDGEPSTACSALCARCVRPSFILVSRAEPVRSPFFGRVRSKRARTARGGVSIPDACRWKTSNLRVRRHRVTALPGWRRSRPT